MNVSFCTDSCKDWSEIAHVCVCVCVSVCVYVCGCVLLLVRVGAWLSVEMHAREH